MSALVCLNFFTILEMTCVSYKKSSECTKPIISPVAAVIPLLIASYIPLSGSDIIVLI